VENFRVGTLARWGFDDETLRQRFPRLVVCRITGYGTDGPVGGRPGYDAAAQAYGGLMSVNGEADGPPLRVGVPIVDMVTGNYAFAGILLALRERDRTGVGQRVEVNLLHGLLAALTNQASGTLATGRSPARLGNAHPSIAPYELFRAADRELVVAVGNDRQFAAFAGVVGHPELADVERFATNEARVRDRDALRSILDPLLASRTAADWVDALTSARVPAGLVNDIGEAFAFAESLGLEPVVTSVDPETGRTSRQPATPIRLDTAPAVHRTPPPLLGAHEARWVDER
jgi:crotonobetainyl-CoA:carnitine CoA-transferase CaiB-like acyl-CoA transferase